MHGRFAKVERAIETDTDDAFWDLYDDHSVVFLVDWRAYDEDIIAGCEGLLQTGHLHPELDGDDLFVVTKAKRLRVPLTDDSGSRHHTLAALNDALYPEFEIRMLYISLYNDTGGFVPLSGKEWEQLERDHREIVERRFHVLTRDLNTFTEMTEAMIPKKE